MYTRTYYTTAKRVLMHLSKGSSFPGFFCTPPLLFRKSAHSSSSHSTGLFAFNQWKCCCKKCCCCRFNCCCCGCLRYVAPLSAGEGARRNSLLRVLDTAAILRNKSGFSLFRQNKKLFLLSSPVPLICCCRLKQGRPKITMATAAATTTSAAASYWHCSFFGPWYAYAPCLLISSLPFFAA